MVTMSAVWDRTTEFLSDNLAAVAAIAGLAILLPSALSGAVAPLRTEAGPGGAMALGLLALVLSIVSVWGQAGVTALALDPARTWREALGRAARRLPLIVALGLAGLLALVVLLLPAAGILAAAGVDLAGMSQGTMPEVPPGASAGIALYLLVLVPVVLWLAARLVLVTPVVLAERQGFASIRRSWVLTRGLAMRIVGVLLLYGVVALVAVLAARTVFGSILELVAGSDGAVTVASVLTAIIASVVSTAFSALAAAFTAKLYVAARDRPAAAA